MLVVSAVIATGCGVLSENLAIKKTEATTSSITITFDAITSQNYDTYELREYGVAYSVKASYLDGVDSEKSSLTPYQNYPRAKVRTVSKQPSVTYGKRQLVTLTITIDNLQSGTTYYFKPYVYGSYYNSGEEINTSYGYGSAGNMTTRRQNTSNPVNLKPGKVDGLSAKALNGKVKLKWNSSYKASGYEVYSSKSNSGSYKRVKITKNLSFTHKKLKRKKNYYYKVRAYRNVNGKRYYGKYSRIVRAKIK